MMKNIKFVLSIFALLTVAVLLSGAAAAQPVFTMDLVSQPAGLNHDAGSFNIKVNVTYTGNLSNINVSFGRVMTEGSATLNQNQITLNQNEPMILDLPFTFPAFQSGNLAGTVTGTPTSGNPATINFSIPINNQRKLSFVEFVEPTINSNGSFKLKNDGNFDLTSITFAKVGNIALTFDPTSISTLNAGQTTQNAIKVMITSLSGLKFGFNPTSIKATASDGTSVTSSSFNIKKTFCSNGEAGGNLSVKSFDVNNVDGDTSDWKILDEVEIEVEIENIGNEDIDDVQLRLGFFDADGNDLADDFDWSSSDEEQVDLGNIRDDTDELHIFKFRIPAKFADKGNDDYKLAIKAWSKDLGESVECVDSDSELSDDFFESITIELENEEESFVIVDDIEISNPDLVCGETVSGQFTVFNVGEDDQERVRTTMRNDRLGLMQEFEVTNLDIGEDKPFQFSFTTPQNIAPGTYPIEFFVDYAYDNGDYEVRADETFRGFINIISCQGSTGGSGSGNTLINVKPTSDSISAGDQVVIQFTVSNTGSEQKTYTVDAADYQSWAEVESISSSTFTLGQAESKDVVITLNTKDTASGAETLTIRTIAGSEVTTKIVEVNVEDGAGFTGFSIFGSGSGYVWVLVLVNVVLIILIILVAVRLSRR